MERMASMDALRGFAILIMFLDHILFLSPNSGFDPFNPRFFTRIAEPVFAVLLGYFLLNRGSGKLLPRLAEIIAVAFFVNLFFYTLTGKLEILASFILVFALYFALRERLVWLIPLVFFVSVDPTMNFLDYPLSLVASQVALGMGLRSGMGPWLALVFLAAAFVIPSPYSYAAIFTAVAAGLVVLAQKFKDVSVPGLSQIGRKPLTYYVIQYALAAVVAVVLFGAK
jgi:uncharacterized membrane protein